MIRAESVVIYQSVNKYHFKPRDSSCVNSIPLKSVVDIFTSDLIIYDENFRAVGIHYNLNHPDTKKGPDITFSLTNFAEIWENLKYRDLLPPMINDKSITEQLFGFTEVPGVHYQAIVNLYSKHKIMVRDDKGKLKKSYG